MKLRLILCTIFALSFVAGICSTNAAEDDFSLNIPLLSLWLKSNPEQGFPRGVDFDEAIKSYKGPVEPIVPKVDFYEFEQPKHLQGRIESLLHGIKITLPSEYDHYGYEIRYYMKSVGKIDIYSSRSSMEDEIVNIEKAWVVLRFWREKLLADIAQLEADIKTDSNASSKVKTLFNVHQAQVSAFIIEMQSWINANDDFLKFLSDNRKQYTFENGRFLFKGGTYARQFIDLFAAREKSKHQIHKYFPFGSVVY